MPKRKPSLAGLFADEDGPSSNGSGPPPKPVDTFVTIDGLLIPDEKTAKRYADAIEARHPKLDMRFMGSLGVLPYLYGVWAIELWKSHERIRFCDNIQLGEIHAALADDDSERFWKLVNGENLPGPYREGRPPINAKGKPLVEDESDRGDYGPLPDECEWIEAHDSVFIRYSGTEPINYPEGLWVVQKAGCNDQLLNAKGVKYVAHTILKMPANFQKKVHKKRPKPTSQFASLFSDEPEEAVDWNNPTEALFAQVAYSNWDDPAQSTPLADIEALHNELVRPRLKAERGPAPGLASLFSDEPEQSTASIASLFV